MWETAIHKISNKISKKNYPNLTIMFIDSQDKRVFNIQSTSEETIKKSLNSIKEVITHTTLDGKQEFFYFNNNTKKWEKLEQKKIGETMEGVITGSDQPIVKDGKIYTIPDQLLPEIAEQHKGMPFHLGHNGPLIGFVLDSWVDGKQVMVKIGIFEDIPEEQKEKCKKMKGFSMAGV